LLGFEAKATRKTGDGGADVIATLDGVRIVIQCKCLAAGQKVGFGAVKEIHTAKDLFSADRAMIITNQYLTRQALETSRKLGIEVWEREI
jgi:restriction system protein